MQSHYHRIVVSYEDKMIDKLSRGPGVTSTTFDRKGPNALTTSHLVLHKKAS
jgi:hypothetical protein